MLTNIYVKLIPEHFHPVAKIQVPPYFLAKTDFEVKNYAGMGDTVDEAVMDCLANASVSGVTLENPNVIPNE